MKFSFGNCQSIHNINGKVYINGKLVKEIEDCKDRDITVIINGNVEGDVDIQGKLECKDIGGDVDCQGNINCGKILGDIDCQGNIRMGGK
jgi:hypothetical protein